MESYENVPVLASRTCTDGSGACGCVFARAAAADTVGFGGAAWPGLAPSMLPVMLKASGPLMRVQEDLPSL